ncbi:MAG: hypothetical protein K2Q24_07720 [Chitinophagaceae bacterium]|nr:hypothetical protein [Chitinophagaceae bacterium]
MKKNRIVFLLIVTISISILSLQTTRAQITVPAKIQKSLQPNKIPGNVQVPGNLVQKNLDLAVTEIRFSIVSVKDRYNGTVKIEGIVKNTGGLNYTSGENQQTILLYEETPGLSPKLVASRNFRNLAVNGTVSVSFTRAWRTSDEFPPSYTAIIVFDPDIYLDGNTSNDDANSANNRLTKQGAEINLLNWKR